MALKTFSRFYYGHIVTDENRFIDFDEGGGEITAELTPGYYSPTEYANEVRRALETTGANTYTVTFNRSNSHITISSTVTFSLLLGSGSHIGQSAASLLGFSASDLTGLSSYESNLISGSIYEPQFILQSFVDKDDNESLIDATVNKTSQGNVEVVRFGNENFIELNIKFITNLVMDNVYIKTNPNGLSDAQNFMKYVITKGRVEFVKDISDVDNFYTLQIEKTPEDQNGVKYKLKEQVTKGIPDVYETGVLTFRYVEL